MDKIKNRNGNKNRYTANIGHDTAKSRLANSLANAGFDIYQLRKMLLSHPTIKMLISKKACYMSEIVGQNFWLGCKNALLSEFCNIKFDNKQTVVQVVNNCCNSILREYGFKNFGKTEFWKSLNPKIYRYSDRIYFGADILSLYFMENNKYYTEGNTGFTCKLNDKMKELKYKPIK